MVLQSLRAIDHGLLLASLALLIVLGARYPWLVIQHLRLRRRGMAREAALLASALPPDDRLPHILVQIPTFNESSVIRRCATAAGKLDWPRDRLHLQFLDDSTDGTTALAAAAVAELRTQGLDAVLRHRSSRAGFKAGALQDGLAHAAQDYVAIVDADYVPAPDFLRAAMRALLADERLAFCQLRWEFLNAGENAVTRSQQRALDAFFGIEQTARCWSGHLVLFTGTNAIWRRRAIDEAGGWQSDTLLEDHDLSYRVQACGWRGIYLVSAAVSGELPSDAAAWLVQQERWNKGFAQVARKALPILWRSRLPLGQKLVASWHLVNCAFFPLLGVVALTGLGDILLGIGLTAGAVTLAGLALLQAIGAGLVMMALAQRFLRGARLGDELLELPRALSLFVYGVLASTRAVLDAMRGRRTEFVRTPKTGGEPASATDDPVAPPVPATSGHGGPG